MCYYGIVERQGKSGILDTPFIKYSNWQQKRHPKGCLFLLQVNRWEGGEVANHELAEKDYMSGMKYQDIADKYGVSVNTVKSWKKRYAWERKKDGKGAHKSKKDAHKIGKGCTQKEDDDRGSREKKEPVAKEVCSVLENAELNERQQLFCLYFVKMFNATKAYQKAYQCNEYTAMVNGSKLLRNTKVKAEIEKLKQEKLNRAFLSEADIFQKYLDIAMTDITDFMTFGNKEIDITDKDGSQKTMTVSHINIKNDYEVDGTLISEISQGRDGIKVKLLDKMKALDWLAAHIGIATEEQKAKVKLLLTQEKVERKKLEDKNNSNQAVDDWIEAVMNEGEDSNE